MIFKHQVTIAFDQCDPGGILFFANAFKLAHQALEAWTHTTEFKWESWFNSKDWGVPLVHVEADYKTPMLAGKTYDVLIKATEVGNSSVTFKTQVLSGEKTMCEVLTKHVFMNLNTFKSMAIPEQIKKELI